MKKYVFLAMAICFIFSMWGCAKKKEAMEDLQEPLTMESLTAMNATVQSAPAVKPEVPVMSLAPEATLEPLPPAGPYKPTNKDIQTALKNANFYTGAIDGKLGPMTKKAIAEFQKANGLEADGKVGPKTWQALSSYLNPAPAAAVKPSKKRR